jgi:hypothetical protein
VDEDHAPGQRVGRRHREQSPQFDLGALANGRVEQVEDAANCLILRQPWGCVERC